MATQPAEDVIALVRKLVETGKTFSITLEHPDSPTVRNARTHGIISPLRKATVSASNGCRCRARASSALSMKATKRRNRAKSSRHCLKKNTLSGARRPAAMLDGLARNDP